MDTGLQPSTGSWDEIERRQQLFSDDPNLENIEPSTGRTLGEAIAPLESPLMGVTKAFERGAYATSSALDRFLFTMGTLGTSAESQPNYELPEPIQTKSITGKEANENFSPPNHKLFNDNQQIDQGLAQLVGKQATDDYQREDLLNRYTSQHSWPINFGVQTAGFLLDPMNVASMFVPGVGSEWILGRVGAETGLAGRVAARSALGASEAVTGQVPLVGLKYGLSQEESQDYDLYSAFKDLAFTAGPGAILRNLGAIRGDEVSLKTVTERDRILAEAQDKQNLDSTERDRILAEAQGKQNLDSLEAAIRKAFDGKTSIEAIKASVAQFVEGRSTDVTPILNLRIRNMVLDNTRKSNEAYDALNKITERFHETSETPMSSEDLGTVLGITRYIQQLDKENASLVVLSDHYPKNEPINSDIRIQELEGHFKQLYQEYGYGKEGFKWNSDELNLANAIHDKMSDLRDNPRNYVKDLSTPKRPLNFYTGEEQRFFDESLSDHLKQQFPYDTPEHLANSIKEIYKKGFDIGLTNKERDLGKSILESIPVKSPVNENLSKTVSEMQARIQQQEAELSVKTFEGETQLNLHPEDVSELQQSNKELERATLDEKGLTQAAGCLKDAGI